MHDPLTVAFTIYYPWHKRFWQTEKQYLKEKNTVYHEPFITIWHRDPEKGGSDDSCGWSFPRVSKSLEKQAKKEAAFECHSYGLFPDCKPSQDPLSTILAVYQLIAWRLFKNNLKPNHLVEILSVCVNPVDNLRRHTLTKNIEDVEELFFLCLRSYLRIIRPWYKHPKWHVKHWSLQIHPLQKLKRYLFERCFICKKGFHWGESVLGDWDGTKIWHFKCDKHLRVKEDK